MKIAYFDCFSGISGDMCLGALVDAGLRLEDLKKHISRLGLKGYNLSQKRVERSGITATMVNVGIKEKGKSRRFGDVRAIIEGSKLDEEVKKQSLKIFELIFNAEAKVHGRPAEEIHLHELSALDCIIDIVGTISGLRELGIQEVFSSAVNLGSGIVKTSHGLLPVPAPATGEILKGVPVYGDSSSVELTTPTGAALIKGLATAFGPLPEMVLTSTGYGAGRKELEGRPNVLRLLIGEKSLNPSEERVIEIQTNIDDMNPQVCEYLMERLYAEGALEVFFSQIIMKKSRPGFVITVLSPVDRFPVLRDMLLRETSTIGVRFKELNRSCLKRETIRIKTPYGNVRFKIAHLDKGLRITPEYEDCKEIAKKQGIPLVELLDILKATGKELEKELIKKC